MYKDASERFYHDDCFEAMPEEKREEEGGEKVEGGAPVDTNCAWCGEAIESEDVEFAGVAEDEDEGTSEEIDPPEVQ